MKSLRDRIFEANKDTFDALCMEIFAIQSKRCKPYKEYIEALEIDPSTVKSVDQIPFMPVSLFKSHNIILDQLSPQITFTSSSTTGMVPAKHPVADISVYQDSFTKGFEQFYGSPKEYAILALLPSYLEREGSSLIYMTESLIKAGKHPKSGFYLYNHDDLHKRLSELSEQNCPTILIGVSFALVDYASAHKTHFPKLIVIETGGMKGRGRELSRDEIHQTIKECFDHIDLFAKRFGNGYLSKSDIETNISYIYYVAEMFKRSGMEDKASEVNKRLEDLINAIQ